MLNIKNQILKSNYNSLVNKNKNFKMVCCIHCMDQFSLYTIINDTWQNMPSAFQLPCFCNDPSLGADTKGALCVKLSTRNYRDANEYAILTYRTNREVGIGS